ncbi:MAG: glycine cleavage system aminomethyltransferase GcvT [Ignavibacteriales bacterium]|nr:glycine cleavage system aminomethyltransferase GcvT [Ignavibacteriales bacterium]
MKRTPFFVRHREAGAKLIEFAGFEMPVQYPAGIVQEHLAVRSAAGLFDVSHMGEVEVRGHDAAAFLQRMTVNDIAKLENGKAQYSAILYDDGGIVDDLLVYHCGDYFMLVVNAANVGKDYDWLRSHLKGDVRLEDASDRTALLAVQGPKSLETLQPLSSIDLGSLDYYRFARGTIAGVLMMISRTGYTGELGFELYFEADEQKASTAWDAIVASGKQFGIMPVGLGARDTLRLEMGYCLYGNDIDQTTNPLEAGLGWITKLGKGDFVGRQALVKIHEEGLKRKLVGFTLPDKNLARHGFALKDAGLVVGTVTSGTFSPVLQRGIGMGYVEKNLAAPGSTIAVDIRGKEVPATVVEVPFIRPS